MAEPQTFPAFDSSLSYDQVFLEMLKSLPEELCTTLQVGALPHFLDEELAKVLFPSEPAQALETLASFPFVSRNPDGQLQYHDTTRRIFMSNWQNEKLDQFRQVNSSLAQEFMRRLEATRVDSMPVAMEWVYHSVAANPGEGMSALANLFHELLETRELGTAERLLRLVGEQRPWLGDQEVWLDNFQMSLQAYRNQPVDEKALEAMAQLRPGSMLAACVRRLQGRRAVQSRQWAAGRKYLQEALAIFERENSPQEQALTQLELGHRFYSQVVCSGGVQVERQARRDWFGALLYAITRLPLLIYKWLADRFDWLPSLYGESYQNLVALSLLRLAAGHYQAAGRLFRMLGNQRGQLETDFYMGRVLLVLGHTDRAAKGCLNALKSPLALSSPYYTARLNLVIAQAHMRREQINEARALLEGCLETFTRYGDWRLALDTAIELGTVLEKLADWPALIGVTAQGLEAAWRSNDPLAETRLASRLEWYSTMPGPGMAERRTAEKLREAVTSLSYIDRFPGRVRQAFHTLASWLAYPFIFLFALTVILGSGFLMQFIEGELVIQSDPVKWSQAIDLIVRLALPVLMLWGYYTFYVVLGHLVAFILSLSRVDQEQPEMWRLDASGLTKTSNPGPGEKEEKLPWSEVRKLVVYNRSLYSQPMMFSSRMYIQPAGGDGSHKFELPASIFRYKSLQRELEKRLPGRVFKEELSLLGTHWLWITLLVGLGVALAWGLGLFGSRLYACYGDPLVKTPQDVCRPEYRIYVQPVVQWGLFFGSVLFGIVTWLRWQLANRRVLKSF